MRSARTASRDLVTPQQRQLLAGLLLQAVADLRVNDGVPANGTEFASAVAFLEMEVELVAVICAVTGARVGLVYRYAAERCVEAGRPSKTLSETAVRFGR